MAKASHVYRLIEVLQQGPRPSESQALASGNNTLTKPSGADGCVIFPDPSNTATLVLKGVNGDTGITLNSLAPCAITCGATFVVNVSANTTAAVRWFRIQ